MRTGRTDAVDKRSDDARVDSSVNDGGDGIRIRRVRREWTVYVVGGQVEKWQSN